MDPSSAVAYMQWNLVITVIADILAHIDAGPSARLVLFIDLGIFCPVFFKQRFHLVDILKYMYLHPLLSLGFQ